MKDFYNKLVDLYAGDELPVELNDQMEIAAYADADLRRDMKTLKQTVEMVHSDAGPEFTEDSYQRILTQIYSKIGAKPVSFESSPLQYQLPISV
jgi:hypothetical protein